MEMPGTGSLYSPIHKRRLKIRPLLRRQWKRPEPSLAMFKPLRSSISDRSQSVSTFVSNYIGRRQLVNWIRSQSAAALFLDLIQTPHDLRILLAYFAAFP